jgi:defect-in-organelle-trafficking protein DotD
MNKNNIILFAVMTLLTACASTSPKKPPMNRPSDDATIKLAEAASAVSRSMLEVAKIEKTITPANIDNTLTIPNSYNLQARASVDWSGPVEELTNRIAKAAHYHFNVLGKEPPIPVLVSLTANDESLAEILRDIDYQAGHKASIHVYPKRQLVELRYAKTNA